MRKPEAWDVQNPGVDHETGVETEKDEAIRRTVLIVDNNTSCGIGMEGALQADYDVILTWSGEEGVSLFNEKNPDLVIIEMDIPGVDGVEVCAQIRKTNQYVPVLFKTAYDTAASYLLAFDAGGSDIMLRPAQPDMLRRKAEQLIRQYHRELALYKERDDLKQVANNIMTAPGWTELLLNFIRTGISYRNYEMLANSILGLTGALNLQCSVMIRHGGEPVIATSHREATPIEIQILNKAGNMGRVFQFKRRLVANHDRISIVIANMPDESDGQAQQVREWVVSLLETAEILCTNIEATRSHCIHCDGVSLVI